jgi:hypothetical protein
MTLDPAAAPTHKSFDFPIPEEHFATPEEEREHVKARLALAYRVLARERLCESEHTIGTPLYAHGAEVLDELRRCLHTRDYDPGEKYTDTATGEGSSGHITSRDPIDPSTFWVNPYGLHFSMMTSSALLYNQAAFVIHSAIHAARPDVNSIVHAHSPAGKAWSTLGREMPFYTQDSAVFWNDVGLYASHGGVVLDDGESAAIIGAMGGKKAVVMQNHGILTVGGCIESAIAWFYL